MFDFLGLRKVDRRGPADHRRARGPITIGIEQLEGRDMLSSGLALTVIPTGIRPPAGLPRPTVGSIRPEADGDRPVVVPVASRPGPARSWDRPWSIGRRRRPGWPRDDDR